MVTLRVAAMSRWPGCCRCEAVARRATALASGAPSLVSEEGAPIIGRL